MSDGREMHPVPGASVPSGERPPTGSPRRNARGPRKRFPPASPRWRPPRSWPLGGRAVPRPRRSRWPRNPGRAPGTCAARRGRGTCSAGPRMPGPSWPRIHQAGGTRVEPVHDAGAERAAGRRERDSHPEQPVHERPAAPAGGGMRHEPAGLHDHDGEVLVLVPDAERAALQPRGTRHARSRSSRVAPQEAEGLLSWLTVARRTFPAAIARCTSALASPVIRARTASNLPSSAASVRFTEGPVSTRAAPSAPGTPPMRARPRR